MKRVLVVFLVLALRIAAEQPINQLKGFNANNVYSINDIDSINAFNGNLTVTIPIGQKYPIADGLSYGLTLVSNWNVWDSEVINEPYEPYPGSRTLSPTAEGDCNPEDGNTAAFPNRRANAGLGWLLTLGRLYPDTDPTSGSKWTYESPDGADHEFFDTLHFDKPQEAAASHWYTRDGSYLRMKLLSNGKRIIEFPDGTIHTFAAPAGPGPWLLEGITNRHSSNQLSITYVVNTQNATQYGNGLDWVLTDKHGREQRIEFARYRWDGVNSSRLLVKKAKLMAFTPAGESQRYAEYTFDYSQVTITRPDWHERCPGSVNQTTIQQLASVTFPDDPSTDTEGVTKYTFTYDNSPVEAPGVLYQATLPTGGSIRWESMTYQKPHWTIFDDAPYLTKSMGVSKRQVLDPTSTVIAQWTYQTLLDGAYDDIQLPPKELRTIISDPLGNKTVSYFSVAVRDPVSPWRRDEYGKPFTHHKQDSSGTRLLSEVRYPASVTPDHDDPLTGAIQTTYLTYESDGVTTDPMEKNWRIKSRRSLTRTGSNDDYVDTDSSDFDGLGHYRSVQVSGSSPDAVTKAVTTRYNEHLRSPSGVFSLPAVTAPWLLNLYPSVEVVQTGPDQVEEKAVGEYCFDMSTGFLLRSRRFRGTAAGTKDLLSTFTADGSGNVSTEKYFGGDAAPLSAGFSTCSGALPPASYTLNHTYSNGVRASSQYAGTTFKVLDLTLDATGLPRASRDTAGVETTYQYNPLGQLREVHPAGEAWTEYSYQITGTGTARALVTARQWPADTPSPPPGTSSPVTQTRYYYDLLGRLIQQRQQMPGLPSGNSWSASATSYDALSRVIEQTVPVGAASGDYGALTAAKTTTVYDALGRIISTTKPDGKVVSVAYKSGNVTERTEQIQTSASASSDVTVKEIRDSHGRLITVVEDATSSAVPTYYAYDEGDRLKSVKDNTAEAQVVQKRAFNYDGAGLLTSEEHPENGSTTYEYDARGHVTKRTEPGSNILNYTYDAAERVTAETHNGQAVKEYTYDTAGGTYSNGKMTSAKRHNRHTDLGGDVTVTESFVYSGLGGRMSSKTTAVSSGPGFTDSYAYDQFGNRTAITYPNCSNCGGLTPPSRTVTNVYDGTYLRRVAGYTSATDQIGYHPNGMLRSLRHLNATGTDGPLYQQNVASDGMPRPSSIDVTGYCADFRITEQPPATKTVSPGAPADIRVAANGATSYEWYRLGETTPISTAQILPEPVSATSSFWARAKNGTCSVDSIVSIVSPSGSCNPLPTVTVTASPQPIEPGASSTLTATVSGPGPWSVKWSDGSTLMTRTVSPTVTTTYTIVEANGCPGSYPSVTVTVCPAPDVEIIALDGVTLGVNSLARVAEGAASYLWTATGAGSIVARETEYNPWFVVGCSGSMTLHVTATASCGTQASNSHSVQILVPQVTLTASQSPITAGQTVTLTASLDGGGGGPFQFEWTDGIVSGTTRTVSPTVTTTYTISKVNGCPGDWGSVTVTVQGSPPPAPTGVTAWGLSATSVRVSWTYTDTADRFAVDRCVSNCGNASSWITFEHNGVSPFTDQSASANGVYIYRVRAIRGGLSSPNSNVDVANTFLFETINAGSTKVQAVHVTQLRTAVNAIRAAAGYTPMSFTDSVLDTTKLIRAVHFTELQTALNDARFALSLSTLSFTPVVQYWLIQDEHVNELRGGVQ